MPGPLDAIAARVRGMVARALVGTVNDAAGVQAMQIDLLADEALDGCEHFQGYGFTSVPHPEAEAVVVFAGGTRSHALVIATGDRRYRLRGLATGEVALFDDLGQVVKLGREGISIETTKPLSISAERVDVQATSAAVTADRVDLGGTGGTGVARIGDAVANGVIVAGSSKVFAR